MKNSEFVDRVLADAVGFRRFHELERRFVPLHEALSALLDFAENRPPDSRAWYDQPLGEHVAAAQRALELRAVGDRERDHLAEAALLLLRALALRSQGKR